MSDHGAEITDLRPRASALPLPAVAGYLLPGETVNYMDRRHPIVLVPSVLAAFGVFVLSGAMVTLTGAGIAVDMFVLIMIGVIGWLGLRIFRWSRTVLVVTSRRVFEYKGLLIKRAAIKPVFRQGIVFRQDPIGARLNYGTITTKAPNGDAIHKFRWIHDPRAFYQALTDRAH